MIKVVKKEEDNNQKIVGTFLKRVKKANQINRIRKTKDYSKSLSALQQKKKALRIAAYKVKQENKQSFGKL